MAVTERGDGGFDVCSAEGCREEARWVLKARGGPDRRVCSFHAAGALTVDHSLLIVPKAAA